MAPAVKLTARSKSNKTSAGWADAASNANHKIQKTVVPFQESHKIKCTKPDCEMLFTTEKEMKNHKKYDPEHFYCKRCNVDCEDWETLTKHKVDVMAPWLEGRIKPSEDEKPEHIVCEFCGEDFKSFGGRKLHRKQVRQI